MQLSPVKVADALGGLLCGRHGDKPIAASAGTLGVRHHLSSDNLQERESERREVWFNQGKGEEMQKLSVTDQIYEPLNLRFDKS